MHVHHMILQWKWLVMLPAMPSLERWTISSLRRSLLWKYAQHPNEDVARSARRAVFRHCGNTPEAATMLQESLEPWPTCSESLQVLVIYDLRGCEKLFLLMHLYAFDYFVYISIPDLEFLKYGLWWHHSLFYSQLLLGTIFLDSLLGRSEAYLPIASSCYLIVLSSA